MFGWLRRDPLQRRAISWGNSRWYWQKWQASQAEVILNCQQCPWWLWRLQNCEFLMKVIHICCDHFIYSISYLSFWFQFIWLSDLLPSYRFLCVWNGLCTLMIKEKLLKEYAQISCVRMQNYSSMKLFRSLSIKL